MTNKYPINLSILLWQYNRYFAIIGANKQRIQRKFRGRSQPPVSLGVQRDVTVEPWQRDEKTPLQTSFCVSRSASR